jgi:thiosulfate dehydrogenase
MNQRFLWISLILLSAGFVWWQMTAKNPTSPGNDYHPLAHSSVRFDLVDPEAAPEDIKPLVMQGYQILLETKKTLPEYAGDRLTCANCHFACGNTLGGANGGISLVGVTKVYPKQLEGGKEFTLAERINACFDKSMSGKPLPVDSQPMKAMLAYLEWISHDVAASSKTPWLGLKELRSFHEADAKTGEHIYTNYCSECHGPDGQGQSRSLNLGYPPVWGKNSFNAKAGMNQLPKLASFVYYNMPYGEAELTIEEALDVAAFIVNQPRPK